MANPFSIRITAIDTASKTIKNINKALGGISRPAMQTVKSLRSLGQVGQHSLAVLSKGLREVSNVGGTTARVLQWLTLPGAATGVVALANQFGNFAFGLNMTAKMLNVNQQELTKWHYAAKLAGVSAEAFDQAWGQGQLAIRAAAYGADPMGLARLANAGITMEKDPKTGLVTDYQKVERDILAAAGKMTGPARQDFLDYFGLGALNPLVTQGTYWRDRQGAGGKGLVQSDDDLAKGVRFRQNLEAMKSSVEGLALSIGSRLVPVVEPLVSGFANWLDQNRVEIAKELADTVGKITGWIKSLDWQKFKADVIAAWDAVGGLKSVIGGLLLFSFAGPIANVLRLGLALGSLGAFFVLNPIGMVITLIATLATGTYELIQHWDEVKAWWHNVWAVMSGDAKTGADKINEAKKSLTKNDNYNLFDVLTDQIGLMVDKASGANAGNSGLTRHVVETAMKNGLTSSSAIGFAANWFQESGYDPAAVNGSHYGIGQWDPARQALYRKWYGRDIHGASLEEQIAFAVREANDPESDAATRHGGATLGLLNDPQAAAMAIAEQIERPGNINQEKLKRAANAVLIQRALGPNFGGGVATNNAPGERPDEAAPTVAAPAGDVSGARVAAMQQGAPMLTVNVHNATPGTRVEATSNGQPIPSRISVSTGVLYGATP